MNWKLLILMFLLFSFPVSSAQSFNCSDVGLRTDSTSAFFASMPEFLMNMIICIQPVFIVLFALGIASALLLVFKYATS